MSWRNFAKRNLVDYLQSVLQTVHSVNNLIFLFSCSFLALSRKSSLNIYRAYLNLISSGSVGSGSINILIKMEQTRNIEYGFFVCGFMFKKIEFECVLCWRMGNRFYVQRRGNEICSFNAFEKVEFEYLSSTCLNFASSGLDYGE